MGRPPSIPPPANCPCSTPLSPGPFHPLPIPPVQGIRSPPPLPGGGKSDSRGFVPPNSRLGASKAGLTSAHLASPTPGCPGAPPAHARPTPARMRPTRPRTRLPRARTNTRRSRTNTPPTRPRRPFTRQVLQRRRTNGRRPRTTGSGPRTTGPAPTGPHTATGRIWHPAAPQRSGRARGEPETRQPPVEPRGDGGRRMSGEDWRLAQHGDRCPYS